MTSIKTEPKTKWRSKPERPKFFKVILLSDEFTPRAFATSVLKAVFRMSDAEAGAVMQTAHQMGTSVVAVFTKEVAETKTIQANEMGKAAGYPLSFTTERER